ncbi:uncharacterized protein VTP21DRAFT_949 [Calcarisporiella thermophila]|uniref:uncharacterized protein n=1 Tax=Calcarisporiella thermophila TaxID=911321 RepID=UPI003742A112
MKLFLTTALLLFAGLVNAGPATPEQIAEAARHCDQLMRAGVIQDLYLKTFAKPNFQGPAIDDKKNVANLACINLKKGTTIRSLQTGTYTHIVCYAGENCAGDTVYDGLGPDSDSNINTPACRLYCGENE